MQATKALYAIRLIGFAPAESAQLEHLLALAPRAGPSYFCLHTDSLQAPELYIANGDDPEAMAQLLALNPGPLQPALVLGGQPGQFPFPRLALAPDAARLYEMLGQLVAQRAHALALLNAHGPPAFPDRRRHTRLWDGQADPMHFEAQRQAPPEGAVLIVDRGGAFRDHVAQVLDGRKRPVEWTDSGSTAIRLCDETPVSLVMINTSTPGIDPYAVCGAIKSQDGGARTAVVFLVSPTFHYDSVRARDAGVRGLLDKPVADRHLVAALHKLLSLPAQTG